MSFVFIVSPTHQYTARRSKSMLIGLLNQSERILTAGRRKRTHAQPSSPEVAGRFVATAPVDNRRSKRRTADCVLQSDRDTADGDRTQRETADRQPEPDCRT